MERYEAAFDTLESNFQRESNGRLFKLANSAYESMGRGAITMLYTNVNDVEDALGTVPASFLPIKVMNSEDDGEEVIEACETYNPKKEFVIAVTIGQDNDITKRTLRKCWTIRYIGQKKEDLMKTYTVSLDELDTRLEKQKSWPCDWCAQRRKLINLKRDPVIGKLVYCNETCFQRHWSQGGADLIKWYQTNRPKFHSNDELERQKKTLENLQLKIT